jgi:hypothetical protein
MPFLKRSDRCACCSHLKTRTISQVCYLVTIEASTFTRSSGPVTVWIRIATRLAPRQVAFKDCVEVAKRSLDHAHVFAEL